MIKYHPLQWLTQKELKQLRDNYDRNMKRFEPPYEEKEFSPVVRFFNPTGLGDWYLAELSPDNIAYGVCSLFEVEIGYVSLDELAEVRLSLGCTIEKDTSFNNQGLTVMEWSKKLKKIHR